MFKNFIIIENESNFQYDTLEELVEALIDDNYFKLNEEEKKEKMTMKAIANTINNKMEIVQELNGNDDIEGKFLIKNEMTFILSLLLTNNIVLLEKKDSNIFTNCINKENIKDNYIVVNKFAKDILKEKIKNF